MIRREQAAPFGMQDGGPLTTRSFCLASVRAGQGLLLRVSYFPSQARFVVFALACYLLTNYALSTYCTYDDQAEGQDQQGSPPRATQAVGRLSTSGQRSPLARPPAALCTTSDGLPLRRSVRIAARQQLRLLLQPAESGRNGSRWRNQCRLHLLMARRVSRR